MLLPQPRLLGFVVLCFCGVAFAAHAQDDEVMSISGQLLMLDDKTPHVACVVQVVTPANNGDEPTVAATTLSDKSGKLSEKLVNLNINSKLFTKGETIL